MAIKNAQPKIKNPRKRGGGASVNKNLRKLLKKEAKKAAERERFHGIDPKSYLGQEILKQSREIIELRRTVKSIHRLLRKNQCRQ